MDIDKAELIISSYNTERIRIRMAALKAYSKRKMPDIKMTGAPHTWENQLSEKLDALSSKLSNLDIDDELRTAANNSLNEYGTINFPSSLFSNEELERSENNQLNWEACLVENYVFLLGVNGKIDRIKEIDATIDFYSSEYSEHINKIADVIYSVQEYFMLFQKKKGLNFSEEAKKLKAELERTQNENEYLKQVQIGLKAHINHLKDKENLYSEIFTENGYKIFKYFMDSRPNGLSEKNWLPDCSYIYAKLKDEGFIHKWITGTGFRDWLNDIIYSVDTDPKIYDNNLLTEIRAHSKERESRYRQAKSNAV